MDRYELLERFHSSKSEHRSLSSSEWQVTVLGHVVGPPADPLLGRVAELGHRSFV